MLKDHILCIDVITPYEIIALKEWFSFLFKTKKMYFEMLLNIDADSVFLLWVTQAYYK